jgi:NADH-quinone oxidoreductase subunit I
MSWTPDTIDPKDVVVVRGDETAVGTNRDEWWKQFYLPAVAGGLAVTLRNMIRNLLNRKGMPTIEYPEERRDYGDRFRGRHYLKKRPSGEPRCVACMMCATACPADCIYIVGGEHPDPEIEKYPVRFDIDGLRCIMCGYCVDACPEDAIAMTKEYEWASYEREDFIWDKEYLLNWRDEKEVDDGYQPFEGDIDKHRMSRGNL